MSSDNPFASPYATLPQRPRTPARASQLPMFSMVVLIIDLVFRFLRVVLVLFSVIGIWALGTANPLFFWGVLEIVTGGAMVIFGILGDSLVLAKKRIGLSLCWIALIATVANLIVGLCEIPLQMDAQMQNGQIGPEQAQAVKIGMLIGGGVVGLLRLGLIIGYGVALSMAKRFFNSQPSVISESANRYVV